MGRIRAIVMKMKRVVVMMMEFSILKTVKYFFYSFIVMSIIVNLIQNAYACYMK